MNDLKELLDLAAGEGRHPHLDPAADVRRGETAVRRRTTATVLAGTGIAAAAAVAAMTLTGPDATVAEDIEPAGPPAASPLPADDDAYAFQVEAPGPLHSGGDLYNLELPEFSFRSEPGPAGEEIQHGGRTFTVVERADGSGVVWVPTRESEQPGFLVMDFESDNDLTAAQKVKVLDSIGVGILAEPE